MRTAAFIPALIFASIGAVAQPACFAPSNAGIEIYGNRIFKNGASWSPKGVSTISFVTTTALAIVQTAAAKSNYGAAELNVMRNTFGADTVRFQVAQPGLDPQSVNYDPAYPAQIVSGISLALSMGFAIVVSMDNDAMSSGTGCMPDAGTVRAWQQIGPAFANNRMVMFEAYNEPCEGIGAPGPADWLAGMQPVVTAIRALGASNIVLLDGLVFARDFRGLSLASITDPLPNRKAFAVHPYLMTGFLVTTDWQTYFGSAADTSPMIGTEWSFSSQGCLAGDATNVAALLPFITGKHIGLTYWAIDYMITLVADDVSYVPTTLTGFTACGDSSHTGAGSVFAGWHT
jgi:endoglucanase